MHHKEGAFALPITALSALCRTGVNFANRTRVSMREIASHDADIFRRLSVRQSAL
jgi:hypothetical protein